MLEWINESIQHPQFYEIHLPTGRKYYMFTWKLATLSPLFTHWNIMQILVDTNFLTFHAKFRFFEWAHFNLGNPFPINLDPGYIGEPFAQPLVDMRYCETYHHSVSGDFSVHKEYEKASRITLFKIMFYNDHLEINSKVWQCKTISLSQTGPRKWSSSIHAIWQLPKPVHLLNYIFASKACWVFVNRLRDLCITF